MKIGAHEVLHLSNVHIEAEEQLRTIGSTQTDGKVVSAVRHFSREENSTASRHRVIP